MVSEKTRFMAVIEADVHRPGAYAQLSQLLEDSSVIVYGEPDEKDAATIVRNGLAACAAADLVIVDTAGRHQLDDELVEELERIASITRATERWLVIDAQVGQAAGPVAASFHDLAGVTGIVVTKLDGTARGGGALSAVAATGAPLVHIGVGEKSRTLKSSKQIDLSHDYSEWVTFADLSILHLKIWMKRKRCDLRNVSCQAGLH